MEDFLGYTIWEEKIERYLLGKMSDAERQAFEKEISSHADLRDKVEFQRKLIAAIGQARKDELKKTLQEEIAEEEKSTFRIPAWSYAVAASVAVFVTTGILFYPTLKEKMGTREENKSKNVAENLSTEKSEADKKLSDTISITSPPPIAMEDKMLELKPEEEPTLNEPTTPKGATIDIMGKEISVPTKTDSVKAITGGIPAQYGDVSGGLISEITRSEKENEENKNSGAGAGTIENTVTSKESPADTDGDGAKDKIDVSEDSKLILAMPATVTTLPKDSEKMEEGKLKENRAVNDEELKPTATTTGKSAPYNVLVYTSDKITSDNQIQYKRAGGEIYVYGSEQNLKGKTNVSLIESKEGNYYLKIGGDVYPVSLETKTLKAAEKISDQKLLDEISK